MKEDWRVGLSFLIELSAISALAFAAITVMIEPLQLWTGILSSFTLSFLGFTSSFVANNPPFVTADNMIVQIIALCAGDLELALLIGAIFATADRTIKDRINGAIAGTLFVMFVNPVRIVATIYAGLTFGIEAMDIVHNVLFRVTLVIVLVVFYAAWYRKDVIFK